MALKLASKGGRAVAPNPMVGAVIAKNGRLIGKGCHEFFGGSHAEVNAIRSVKNPDDLVGATLYVTLEPCRHYGKTPPCTLAIQKAGIGRVVCGSRDPYIASAAALPLSFANDEALSGARGSQQVPDRAMAPAVGFLSGSVARECQKLNKFFFTWVTKKRPFVTVKIATSADGFVAGVDGKPVRFTSPAQNRKVHQLRADHQAILIGIGTVLSDDPRLDVRLVKGEDPLRIVLDSNLRIAQSPPFFIPTGVLYSGRSGGIPSTDPVSDRGVSSASVGMTNYKILKDKNVLIATTRLASAERVLELQKQDFSVWVSPTGKQVSLKKLMRHLAEIGISSVLVEPGPMLYQSFKKAGLIDELIVMKGKKKLGKGVYFSQ